MKFSVLSLIAAILASSYLVVADIFADLRKGNNGLPQEDVSWGQCKKIFSEKAKFTDENLEELYIELQKELIGDESKRKKYEEAVDGDVFPVGTIQLLFDD